VNPTRRIIVPGHKQRQFCPTFYQSPGDKLDYEFDFAACLESGETIASVAYEQSPEGLLTASDLSNTTTTAKLYVTGTTEGRAILVTCTGTTNAAVPRKHVGHFLLRLVKP
jgi:hypothetical protein